MINPLSFNDWLDKWIDDIPEDVDLEEAYEEYCGSVAESNIEAALSHSVRQL